MSAAPSTPPPWSEHRVIAETIGQAAADAVTAAVGSNVELGIGVNFDSEHHLSGRPLPLRAIVVHFHRPLRDVMIFITSLREDVVRPLVEVAAQAVVAALDSPTGLDDFGELGTVTIDAAVEYDTIEDVHEQTDALFLEATYSMDLPTGELRLVLGTGLLEAAACMVNCIQDPFSVEAPYTYPTDELVLGDAIELGESIRYELGEGALEAQAAAVLEMDAQGAPTSRASGDGIDAFDAMLAAQEHAEAEAAAAIAAGSAATERANVEAAELPNFAHREATQRWTELLSGVEVELSAELGRTSLTLGDITSLDTLSVLTLDQLVDEPVDVFVNGTRYATARLVVVDGEYGIEILEVIEQLELNGMLAA